MSIIEQELRTELTMLQGVARELREKLKRAPNVKIRISSRHGKPECYYKAEGESKGNGRYVKKQDWSRAIAILQRDYDRQLLENTERRIHLIEDFVKGYGYLKPEETYDLLNPYRRELVTPNLISDKEYVKRWLQIEYEGKSFSEGASCFISEKGEQVRSKSEKIIADKLFLMNIPYRYEYPILLSNSIRVYPDFTILKMPERKEVYLEHFGLLDDETYFESAFRKLNSYSENGIFLGDKLFITYETNRYPLNTKMLEKMLQKFCRN